jgi:tRNA dimethylallyltransferase
LASNVPENVPAKEKIVVVVGPTASGKTSLGISLAEQFHGEVVCADSRQIYRGMDIGTAKPSPVEMNGVPHHVVNVVNPNQEYSVADYKVAATAAIKDVLKRNHVPIMVGGTGLYIKTVVENLDLPQIKSDPALRAQIEKEIEASGLAAAFERLVALDPDAANVVDAKNPRRVVRALEVALITGEPFTAQRKKNEPLWDSLTIGIELPLDQLREKINLRIDLMIQDGLVQEVIDLTKKYGNEQLAFEAIGYREIIDFLNDKISLQEATDLIKMNTWHYAKRQLTWFKKDKTVHWVNNKEEAVALVENFLQK